MPAHRMALPGLLLLLGASCLQHGVEARGKPYSAPSNWYDWGLHGAYPHQSYHSFGGSSPKLNLVQRDSRCHEGLVFLEPRGTHVDTPGPVIVDNDGSLVWMSTAWGEVMDVKVQQFNGSSYITFWQETDGSTAGEGAYIMLDESYEVFKKITPVGRAKGDSHEFRITKDGTALITMYQEIQAPLYGKDLPASRISDSVFQEIDLHSDELLFEWRASDHISVDEGRVESHGQVSNPDSTLDFFHIDSVDKGADGNYLISSRYMGGVAGISREDGRVLWQLGGDDNDFEDHSRGAATGFTWVQHASWYENTTLTLFENGSEWDGESAQHSRALMIELDLQRMTATLVHSYRSPQQLHTSSQGSVQVLPNENVIVGWGNTPAYTEFSPDGEVLCDTHLGPVWFANRGWVQSYRTSKYNWIGRPSTVPDVAVRPDEEALYVSWNGATEVDEWALQSDSSPDLSRFIVHKTVVKTSFETRISLPSNAEEFVRVVALDSRRRILGYSNVVSRHIQTAAAPTRNAMPAPARLLAWAFFGSAAGITLLRRLRGIRRRRAQYQRLPTSEKKQSLM